MQILIFLLKLIFLAFGQFAQEIADAANPFIRAKKYVPTSFSFTLKKKTGTSQSEFHASVDSLR